MLSILGIGRIDSVHLNNLMHPPLGTHWGVFEDHIIVINHPEVEVLILSSHLPILISISSYRHSLGAKRFSVKIYQLGFRKDSAGRTMYIRYGRKIHAGF